MTARLAAILHDQPPAPDVWSRLLAGRWAYALLALFALALFLPGTASIPPTDRDEARFAQASRQMVESGDYVNIRFQDEARNKKPVGIYWLQASAARIFGKDSIWPYRLPSWIGATLAVLALAGLGSASFGRGAALLAAFTFAAALIPTVEAHIAKTDAMLLLTVTAAQLALARIYLFAREDKRADWRWAALFWAAQGVGILIKGPVTPLISAFTVVALGIADRKQPRPWAHARDLRPLAGIVFAALIAAPWFVAISLGDSNFMQEAVGQDLLPKLIGGQEAHGAPPGYYLLTVTLTFWPASLIGWLGAIWAWRARRTTTARFLLAWLIPAWIMFELIPTKLPHYTLPMLPAVALMAALALRDAPDAIGAMMRHWAGRLLLVLWSAIGLILGFAFIIATWMTEHRFAPSGLIPIVGSLFAVGLAGRAFWRGEALRAAVFAIACVILIWPPIFGRLMPGLKQMWPAQQVMLAVKAQELSWPPSEPIAAVGYHEPSLVFFLGTDTMLATPNEAAAYLAGAKSRFAVVNDREEQRFREAVKTLGAEVWRADTVRGFNMARGRFEKLTLYWSGTPR
ncbi:MAG TPA: glycosyltransferase family 39 protein [Alphaproteobacteria bacterium]|nr:glycosyltransferase family 39 protein [Alphaproteobacteria bacterium]